MPSELSSSCVLVLLGPGLNTLFQAFYPQSTFTTLSLPARAPGRWRGVTAPITLSPFPECPLSSPHPPVCPHLTFFKASLKSTELLPHNLCIS